MLQSLSGCATLHHITSKVVERQNRLMQKLLGTLNSNFLFYFSPYVKEVESFCMQALLAVPAPAQAAPPVDIRHTRRLHTPSPPLQRILPSQRLGCWNRGQVGAPLHPLNWCSSSQRFTVAPQQQQQLLNSIPMVNPLQESGRAHLQELSQVSCFSLPICIYNIYIHNIVLILKL